MRRNPELQEGESMLDVAVARREARTGMSPIQWIGSLQENLGNLAVLGINGNMVADRKVTDPLIRLSESFGDHADGKPDLAIGDLNAEAFHEIVAEVFGVEVAYESSDSDEASTYDALMDLSKRVRNSARQGGYSPVELVTSTISSIEALQAGMDAYTKTQLDSLQ